MSKNINFSFVAIMKNEINVLPRLFDSIQWLLQLGVDFTILDTGSTDDSVNYARTRGAKVVEVGEKYISTIDENLASVINNKFVKDGRDIVKPSQRLFNFAAARNEVASHANRDFVFTLDCDEAYSKFNVDEIIRLIEEGVTQFEYEFVYAHDAYGNPAVQFIQSKAYDRRVKEWKGIIHEILMDKEGTTPNIRYIPENIIKLEHWQEPGKAHRGNYLPGLSVDCYMNPDNDRNSHYFARELMYHDMPLSAITEFKRHISMDKWVAEKAQSMIYIGDCYGKLHDFELQKEYYLKAFETDPHRREALIKLAMEYRNRGKWQEVAVYASGATEIDWNSYYANDKSMYTFLPHELLYEANGWMGKIEKARQHLMECIKYAPLNPKFLHDTRFFCEYPSSMIDGWMSYEEEEFLYKLGKLYNGGVIAEIGSFKGRSTKALLTGNKDGIVYAIDNWEGSIDPNDLTGQIYKEQNVFSEFTENLKDFSNLKIMKSDGVLASKTFADESLDVVFIDAEHTEDAVYKDIMSWLPKVKKGGVICGHDYKPDVWMTVIEGVKKAIGEPDDVRDTIWVKYL